MSSGRGKRAGSLGSTGARRIVSGGISTFLDGFHDRSDTENGKRANAAAEEAFDKTHCAVLGCPSKALYQWSTKAYCRAHKALCDTSRFKLNPADKAKFLKSLVGK